MLSGARRRPVRARPDRLPARSRSSCSRRRSRTSSSPTLRLFEPEAAARKIELSADLDGEASALVAPAKIERVLFNLLTNALRHTPSDGSVAVCVEQRDEDVLVRVEDTGEGLAADAPERMFDRFWRADRARGTSGTGPRPRDRPRHRRGPRRPHLGREPPPGRRAGLVHAAGRRRPQPGDRRRGSLRSRLTDSRRRPHCPSARAKGMLTARARLRPVT